MENPVIEFLDCCISDYFQGHKNQWLCVHPTSKTTIREIIEMLKDEANSMELTKEHSGYDHDDFDKAMEVFIKDNEHQLDKIAFDDIEDDNEYGFESVTAYFVVVEG